MFVIVSGMSVLQRMGITSYATLPRTAGDVAQVRDLPPAVAQAFGINVSSETVTRTEAKTIPSVRRGEQVIAGTLSGFPLIAQRIASGEDGRPSAVLPDITPIRRALLEDPDPNLTPSEWKRRVVEDLIYEPFGLCRRHNAGDGFPRYLEHLDLAHVTLDFSTQTVRYHGAIVPTADIVRFDSPGRGLLKDGAVVLKTALLLEAAVRRFADLDVPLGTLSDPSNGTPSGQKRMTDTEIDDLLDRWSDPKRRRSTRFIGRLKYDRIQLDAAAIQLAEARQRSDVAVAQLLNLESHEVNAPGETGMTYTNVAAIFAERIVAIGPYMRAITERLSMADLTPRGQSVVFDTTRYLRGSVADAINVAVAASGGAVMTRDEARARFLDLPPLEEATPDA